MANYSTTSRSRKKFLEPNTVYHSNNCGDYIFLSEAGYNIDKNGKKIRTVKIKFLQTGYESIVSVYAALKGGVKDPYYPSVCGIGYRGNISTNEYTKEEYDMWFHMLHRIYDKNDPSFNRYGGLGVTVDPRWHSLENFIHDIHQFPEYNEFVANCKLGWALDKDVKQRDVPREQRHYGPDVCTLVPVDVNSRMASVDALSKTSSKYLGVHALSNGNFQSRIMIDGQDIFLGTYSDEIAAANMYNHIMKGIKRWGDKDSMFLNDVPYMDMKECLRYKKAIPIKLPPHIKIPEIRRYNNDCKKPKSQRTYFREYRNRIVPMAPIGHKYIYRLTNIPDEERRVECLRKYGIEFL